MSFNSQRSSCAKPREFRQFPARNGLYEEVARSVVTYPKIGGKSSKILINQNLHLLNIGRFSLFRFFYVLFEKEQYSNKFWLTSSPTLPSPGIKKCSRVASLFARKSQNLNWIHVR